MRKKIRKLHSDTRAKDRMCCTNCTHFGQYFRFNCAIPFGLGGQYINDPQHQIANLAKVLRIKAMRRAGRSAKPQVRIMPRRGPRNVLWRSA
jgi:hypothetical protein